MPFVSKDPNNKSDAWKYNKNGTPRKHGDLVQVLFGLEPEYLKMIETRSSAARVSKSKIIRDAVHYYFRDDKDDQSIKVKMESRARAMENDAIEMKLAENGAVFGDLLSEMKCIGRNLNQVTKKINEGYGDQSLSNEVQNIYALKSEIEAKINDFTAWMAGFYGEY